MQVAILYTPPVQNHYFWIPEEGTMEPQGRQEAIFRVIEDRGEKVMLFKKLLETFLDLKPPPGKRWVRPWAWKLHPVYI